MIKTLPQFNLNIPSHIFLGSPLILKTSTIDLIKKVYCEENCNSCPNCIKINNNSHENVNWLIPDKQYNIEQIDNIRKTISFNHNNEKCFIIFQQADLLTPACSNRLLKSIEEPTPGYYFIFLTQRPNLILPTIYSRCVVTTFESNNTESLETNEIGKFFINLNNDPIEFLKVIDKSSINEHESIELLDSLIHYWAEKSKYHLINNNEDYYYCQNILEKINDAFKNSIMPGSCKLFWKNLFLKLVIN